MADGAQDLRRLANRFDAEVRRKRADQRAIHERLGARMQAGVRGQIRGRLNDAHGTVAGWQEKYIGSGGGYSAVRPTNSSSGPDSPGAITNYLENGHARRMPSGRAKRYRPRIKVVYVSGRGFYNAVRPTLARMLQSEVTRWGDEVATRLGGK